MTKKYVSYKEAKRLYLLNIPVYLIYADNTEAEIDNGSVLDAYKNITANDEKLAVQDVFN